MTLLTVEYTKTDLVEALPKATRGFNPPVLVEEFGFDAVAAIIKALNTQEIRPLGKIGTNGATPFPVNAKGRGSIEVLLEIISMKEPEESVLHDLAKLMRETVLALFETEKYQGGVYGNLEIVSMVIVHKGILVSKG